MKRIIIMGASSGLGRALAERYIRRGWMVGVAARNEAALEELRDMSPERVRVEKIDITSADAPERLSQLIAQLGGMDVYLHCSGILKEELTMEPEVEASVAETNAVGFARMISAAYKYFKENASGRTIRPQIAAISSIAGVRGLGDLPAYSASKAFDSAYLEALRQKAHKDKLWITITDIKPGWTRTPLLESARKYLLEMDAENVVNKIYRAINNRKRVAVIGIRWKVLTALERHIPGRIWEHLHLPLWKDKTQH